MADLPAWARRAEPATTSTATPSWAQPAAAGDTGAGAAALTAAELRAREKQEEAEEKARIAAQIGAAMELEGAEQKRLKKETKSAAKAADRAASEAKKPAKPAKAENPFAAQAVGMSAVSTATEAAPSAVYFPRQQAPQSAEAPPAQAPTGAGANPFASASGASAAAPAPAAPAPAKPKKAPKLPLTVREKAAAEREKATAREEKERRRAEEKKGKKKKRKDRCFGVPPLWGCAGCLGLGLLASFMASLMLMRDSIVGFGVACCLDAVCNIGAFMFLFGPRKYCKGAFINGPARMCAALTYWALIGATLVLCFVPGVPFEVLVLSLICMKVAWAVNLAAACGCLGAKGSSKEAAQARRDAKQGAIKYVVKNKM